MPKGSQELTNARREEIVNACASLYETRGFREITMRDIGEQTSFTRTSLYNYFHTKEEIFLALLQREHEAWIADLEELELERDCGTSSAAAFANALARTLEKRGCMLKLMSMNLYEMEAGSRLANLVAFKQVYANALRAMTRCLERAFPRLTPDGIRDFLYAFFPFLFGVYPYTSHTEKQRQAMEQARVPFVHYSVFEIVRAFVLRQLQGVLTSEKE